MTLEVPKTIGTRQLVRLIAKERDGAEGLSLIWSQFVHTHSVYNVEHEDSSLVSFTGGNGQKLTVMAPRQSCNTGNFSSWHKSAVEVQLHCLRIFHSPHVDVRAFCTRSQIAPARRKFQTPDFGAMIMKYLKIVNKKP